MTPDGQTANPLDKAAIREPFVVDAGGYDTIQSPIKSDIWIKQVVNDGQIVFIPDFFEPVFQQSAVFHFREVSHSDICGRRHLQACYI